MEDLITWIINNLGTIFVSTLISAIVSGVASYAFSARLEKKRSQRIERKDHLNELKEIVLLPMLEVLDSYSSSLKYFINENPSEFTSIRPTNSKLFDVSHNHFPKLMEKWRNLEEKLLRYSQNCRAFYEGLGEHLAADVGLPIHDRFNMAKQPFISRSYQNLLYRSILKPRLYEDALSGLDVKKSTYADAKEAYELYWQGTTYAIGKEKQMQKCKTAFEKMAEKVDITGKAQSLLEEERELSKETKEVENTLRDIIERKDYSGKCRYCP